MGCCESRDPSAQHNPLTDPGSVSISTDGADGAAAGLEIGATVAGVDLQEVVSTLEANPITVTSSAVQAAVSSIGEIFRGVRPQLRLTFPIELVGRCIMNRMITLTEGTDWGNVVSSLVKDDLSEIKEGINVLRSAPLKTSADQLKSLLRTIPHLKNMEDGPRLDAEIVKCVSRAETLTDHADTAFHTVATPGEKIRAVVIACAAIQSSAVGPCNPEIVRESLGSELEKLFSLPAVQRDIAHQLNETRDYSRYFDIEKDRVARLESALGALVHAEAFVASFELAPIMHEFVPVPFSVKKLVATGLFKGKTSVPELRAVGEFSKKELCVLDALCDEPQPGHEFASNEELKAAEREAAAAERERQRVAA
eukprot:CAMPEP_0119496490 /NCGR_PEP_ID=MMETSP1344-20130328/19812_1 /TAXON_ID=236787 /ORGANISM="Florenciella parvula, Strain CCMP2471" /LENGTH=366 /DNA_ID=CAMNT_0007532191 /DNA_START=184 /DNA_END=1280 /DNA_ORIENTATION=+